jgi:PAS domain S-box-containing protein
MRARLSLQFLLFILLISSPALAQTAPQPADPVVLQSGKERYPLGRHLEILTDPSRELTIQDVTSPAYQDQFFLSQVDVPNFGYQRPAYWVRFRLINQTEDLHEWVLDLSFANMHYLDLYLPIADGEGYEVRQTGVLRPFESRDIPFHHLAFKLEIVPGGEQIVYLRFQNEATMTLPLTLWTERAFTNYMLVDQLFSGVYYGALFILLLFNLFLLSLFRQRAYAYLVLFIFSFTGFYLFYEGFVLYLIQIDNPKWVTTPNNIFLGLALAFFIKFVDSLMELAARVPSLHRSGNVIVGLILLILLSAPFSDYQFISIALLTLVIAVFIAIFGLTVFLLLRNNFRPARYLFASLVWFLIGGILGSSVRLGILPSMAFTESMIEFGVVWMAMTWSLALTDKIHTLKDETIAANRKLQESETRLAQFLDAVPVGVVVYGPDLRPRYFNRESKRLLTNPDGSIAPDLTLRRRLPEAMAYFSFRVRGTGEDYPLEQMPMVRALRGESAFLDDIEFDRGDRRIPVESWGSPLFDPDGNITGAVVAFQDISDRIEKEAILQESEERFRVTFEQAAVGIAHVSTEGRFLRLNQQFCEIVGYSREEMIALTYQELTHPDDLELDLQNTDQLMNGEIESFSMEKRYLRKDGKPVWVGLTVSLLREETGEPKYFIAVVQDIDKRKAVEEALRYSQELQQLAVTGAQLGIWSNDLVSGEIYWDARTREIFGVPTDERATLDLAFNLIHPDDREMARAAFERAIETGSDGSYGEEKRIVRPDGQMRWISTKGNAVFADQNSVRRAVRLVGVVQDITERKEAERNLEESRIRYRRLVEIMNEGLGEVDEKDVISYVNPRMAEMLGYTQKEMVGCSIFEFFSRDMSELISDQLARRRKGESDPYTITWQRKDGSLLHTLNAPAPVFDEQGRFSRSIIVVTDISEQVQASQLLEQRVAERTHELSTLLEVSHVVVGDLELKSLLALILEKLKLVVNFSGAAIFSIPDRSLISPDFQFQVDAKVAAEIAKPYQQPEYIHPELMHGEAIILNNVMEDSEVGRNFRSLTAAMFGVVPPEMCSWMGVPLRIKDKLLGILSVHYSQPDYYTPEMARLTQAFANQTAVIIENSLLYRQAQAAAAAEERRRLARELHDSVTQALYGLTLYAKAAQTALAAGKVEVASRHLEEVNATAQEGMADLRLLIFELRPSILDSDGLVAALQERLQAVEKRTGCNTICHVEGVPALSAEVETELYWIVNEALNNVLKHARATNVILDLRFIDGDSTITVRDDGVGGADPAVNDRSTGMGIRNIAERVERLGGRFRMDSQEGQGTIIEVRLGNSI